MRYFSGQQSRELEKWVENTWKQYVQKGEFKKALNLFFSDMNSKKFLHFRKIIFHSIIYYIRKILSSKMTQRDNQKKFNIPILELNDVSLRLVTLADAEFILSLRNNEELNKHISYTNSNVDEQKKMASRI